MQPVRLGLIGCGICAEDHHRPALEKLRDKFEIISVSSRDENKAREFAERIGANRFATDYHDVLLDSEVEAVVISYPFEMNYQITRDALKAGKHVLMEKPLAGSMEDAKKMLEMCENTSLITAVAENWIYWPLFKRIKEHIDQGSIGNPTTIISNNFFYLGTNIKHMVESKWRLTSKGGFILDGAIHRLAGMRMIFGRIVKGIGTTSRTRDHVGEFDQLTAQFLFESGVTGVMFYGASVTGYRTTNNFIILGSEGSITVENGFKTVTVMDTNGSVKEEIEQGDGGYEAEFLGFYDAIRNGKKTEGSVCDAYHDFQAMWNLLYSKDQWDSLGFYDRNQREQDV